MKALILAGGLGTRLRPLTYTRPKHLLPIANRPHLEHVFDLLLAQDISDVVLTTSYLADAFAPLEASARARGMTVTVTHEPEPLGTAGAMQHALEVVGGDAFLAFNGDVLTDCDLGTLIEFHHAHDARATILLTPVDDPSSYGVVPTDESGRVVSFVEKPPAGEAPTNMINAGVYVLDPSALDQVPPGVPASIERDVFPRLVEENRSVFALATDAYWMDIGTPGKYLQANLDALAGRYATRAVAEARDGVLIGPGATIPDDARLSSSCLGDGVVVGRRSWIRDSVILPRTIVEDDVDITGSILGEGVRVRAGAKLTDRTIGDGEEIGG